MCIYIMFIVDQRKAYVNTTQLCLWKILLSSHVVLFRDRGRHSSTTSHNNKYGDVHESITTFASW